VLSDGNTPFEDIGRPRLHARRRADHPAAFDIDTTLRRVPATVRVHDYNYRTPTLSLLDADRSRRAAAVGEWNEFGEHAKTRDDVRALAVRRQEELACQHHTITGYATEAGLRAGRVVHIVDSVASEQAVLLTRVHYRFRPTSDGSSEAQGWENRFEGIPANVAYRPPRVTATPKIAGFMNAVIDGAICGDYAELDDMGRYRLQLAHDRSGRTDLGATHPVRMMQPHGGANYGMHFPLRPGTEVLVGFVNGDPDRPLIVGAAPNPTKTSPVAARNQTQNVLRTGSNNELVLEDLKEHERIRIHTPHAATTLQMGSPEEAEEGFLLTTEAHVTAASRRSNNTVTDRQTTVARSSTTVLGERLVMLAGVRGIAEAANTAIERPGAASAERIAAGLHRLTRPPIPAGSTATPERPAMPPIVPPAEAELHSDAMARASERSEAAAIELVRTLTRTAETGLEAAMGRIQGEPLGEPTEPAAILGSDKLAALVGRENVLVSGDRTATLSSTHSTAVIGHQTTVLKSAGQVEVAGGRSVHVTSGGVVDVAAKTSRIVAGYYPEAEAPELDDGTSLGVMSRRDLRIHSVEDCILVCANKNLIGSAHEGDVRLHAKETVLLQGGSLQGSAGQIALNASEDVKVEAGGAIAVKAAADVTIEGATVTISAGVIRLVGSVFVEGDLMCSGNSNLK
jgi:uncharacterized protein (DUF2345 family)